MRSSLRFILCVVSIATLVGLGCKKDEATESKDKTDEPSAGKAAPAESKDNKGEPKPDKAERTEPANAVAHLDESCSMAFRVDVKKLFAAPVVKDNVVAALEKVIAKEPKTDDGREFHKFLEMTELNPLTDVHELAVCVGTIDPKNDDAPDAVGIVSGTLSNKIVDGVINTNKDVKFDRFEVAGGTGIVESGTERIFGQAEDGVLVMSNKRALFDKAMAPSNGYKDSKALTGDAMIAADVPGKTISALVENAPDNPLKAPAKKITGVTVEADITTAAITVRIGMPSDKEATELGGIIKMLLKEASKEKLEGPEGVALKALSDAKIEYKDSAAVMVIQFPKPELETWVKMLGSEIGKELD